MWNLLDRSANQFRLLQSEQELLNRQTQQACMTSASPAMRGYSPAGPSGMNPMMASASPSRMPSSLPMWSYPRGLDGDFSLGPHHRQETQLQPQQAHPQRQSHQRSGLDAAKVSSERRKDDNIQPTPLIPFTVKIVLPETKDSNGEIIDASPPVPHLDVIKSCWPGSSKTLAKSVSIAEFTRYIVETLCCNNPSFVSSVLSVKTAKETTKEWNQRRMKSSASDSAEEALFVYGTCAHGGSDNCLATHVVLQPAQKSNMRNSTNSNPSSSETTAETSTADNIVVRITLSDANFYPNRPLPTRDNAHQVISCHYKLAQMLRQQGASGNSAGPKTDEGLSLLLRVEQVDSGAGPSCEMPACLNEGNGQNGNKNEIIEEEKDAGAGISTKRQRLSSSKDSERRKMRFTYAYSKNDSRGWSKEYIPPGGPYNTKEVSFLNSSDNAMKGSISRPLAIATPAKIPFTVTLMLPRELQNRLEKKLPRFATVDSVWSGEHQLPSSKATMSEFTRHVVEDLFCQLHPAFATTVVTARADDESFEAWVARHSCTSTSALFSYGTIGNGTDRRCLKTTVSGNMLDYAKETSEILHNNNIRTSHRDENYEVTINFSLSSASIHSNLRFFSQSNAHDVLSCYYKAQREFSEMNNMTWDGKVKLILHMDSTSRAAYEMPLSVLKSQRSAEHEGDERIMELSYTRTYRKPTHNNEKNNPSDNNRNGKSTPEQEQQMLAKESPVKVSTKESPVKLSTPTQRPQKYSRTNSEAKQDFAASVLLSLGTKHKNGSQAA